MFRNYRFIVGMRFTASYVAGIVGTSLLLSPRDPLLLLLGALILSYPLYILGLIATVLFARSIVSRPAAWSAAAVAVVVLYCVFLLIPGQLTFAIEGPVSAILSAILFYCWNRKRPVAAASQ